LLRSLRRTGKFSITRRAKSHNFMDQFEQEVKAGDRFTFGSNWARFLSTLNDERIAEAEKSLREMIGVTDLKGIRFLDVGSGSGLFSLAARRLGAQVRSFDYDPQSVACAIQLRKRFFSGDASWTIERGSALDASFLSTLETFDIVYSWGVLHHTGQMWKALDLVGGRVKKGGKLFVALYNDQGWRSRFWWRVKKTYCSGLVPRLAVCAVFIPYMAFRAFCKSLLTGTNVWSNYKKTRGMSLWHDWIDWLGGFPFEVATADAVVKFYEQRGFTLFKLKTTASLGNNEFVFVKK